MITIQESDENETFKLTSKTRRTVISIPADTIPLLF